VVWENWKEEGKGDGGTPESQFYMTEKKRKMGEN